MLPVVEGLCCEVAYYRFGALAFHPSRCGVDLRGEVAVGDGVGHCFVVIGSWLSQSLAQCSLVTARCPLRFGVSIQIDAGFQLAIYAIVEMRRSRVLASKV